MVDLSFRNNRFPKKGSVLISDPFIADGYFTRSVVLLCDYSKEGAFGFVLTNYLEFDFTTIDSSFPIPQAKVSVGGPVDTEHLFYIHNFGSLVEESILIKDNLYFGGNYSQLQEIILEDKENEKYVRFFLGYSGWGASQLIEELKEKFDQITQKSRQELRDFVEKSHTQSELAVKDLVQKITEKLLNKESL